MIDFKDELKKFKPIMEIDEIEDSIYNDEIKDIMELLNNISGQDKEGKKHTKSI